MSATEDESQSLDAGWDDEAPSDPGVDEIDQAWDSVPAPISAAAPSQAPATEEVDSGWDDVPTSMPERGTGKRRPHRQRRQKTSAVVQAVSPVLLPRPAEPTKKHQRDHARKQRLHEAQVRQQRKAEKKAQRAAEMREEAAARVRQREAEERARQARREARERADGERASAKPRSTAKPKQKSLEREAAPRASRPREALAPAVLPKRKLSPLVMGVLIALAVALAWLLLRK